jgi:hypothetical protein
MSWAEFVLRSIGFRKQRDFEKEMTRAVAYQGYVLSFQHSKQRPKPINVWWPIGEKRQSGVTEEHRQAFIRAQEKARKDREQKEQENGSIKRAISSTDKIT